MSRFKFRIWNKNRKSFKVNCDYKKDEDVPIEYYDSSATCFLNALYDCQKDDNYIIQQFTGLTDKNNKEIYEGDIVKFDETQIGGHSGIGEILYNTDMTLSGPGFLMFVIKVFSPLLKGQSGGIAPFPFNCEVIGNIFENPELL